MSAPARRPLTVVGYIAAQPDEWQPALRKLRTACRNGLPGYREALAHGMPAYSKDGHMEVAFALQAHYLSVYVLKADVLDAHREQLGRVDMGKGCIRYRKPFQMDWKVIASMLAATAASAEEPC